MSNTPSARRTTLDISPIIIVAAGVALVISLIAADAANRELRAACRAWQADYRLCEKAAKDNFEHPCRAETRASRPEECPPPDPEPVTTY